MLQKLISAHNGYTHRLRLAGTRPPKLVNQIHGCTVPTHIHILELPKSRLQTWQHGMTQIKN